jgi:outer membrane protein
MRIISCITGFLLLGSVAQAADLATMQKMAVDNRAVVQRYMTQVEQSEKDVIIARGGYYPSVDISYVATALNESTTFEDSRNSIACGRVSWNLFTGFRDKYTLASAEQAKEVETYRLQGVRQDIQLNVALGYLFVYDRQANLKVAEDAFKTLEQLYRDGENRYNVGLIGKNELLKFRVDYDNAEITGKAAQATLDTSVITVGREVGAAITCGDLNFAEFAALPGELSEQEYQGKMRVTRSEL